MKESEDRENKIQYLIDLFWLMIERHFDTTLTNIATFNQEYVH